MQGEGRLTSMTFDDIQAIWLQAEKESLYYKGDIRPTVIESYVETVCGTTWIHIDVQYHSKGYCALYAYNVNKKELVLEQD
jgi:hypothetical protein